MHPVTASARRRFLKFLAASPIVLAPGLAASVFGQEDDVISAPEQALNVFEFEAAARKRLPPAHFGYIATGVDDDATLRANREAFGRYQLRVRRLVDTRRLDTSISLFGRTWPTPIVIMPTGSQQAFHPDGDLATARAARARGHLQILSTMASYPVEEVIKARGEPVWYQLYPTDQFEITRALVRRAQAAGCPALVLTVDLQGGSNRETEARSRRRDSRDCAVCHKGDPFKSVPNYVARKPMFSGLDVSAVTALDPFLMDWDFVKRLRDLTTMKLLVKGIVTREDAELGVEHGLDGVIVSNHGGRGEESGRGTIESVAEVVAGVKGRVPVVVDGGFRRGTDVFKALALGATAVGIGRPYLWGLGSFGQPGVEAVLGIVRRELETVMHQAGTVSIRDIAPACVIDRGRW